MVTHFVMFVAFHDRAVQINDEVPIHYHFAAAYFINALVLELLLIFFKTQEMKKLKVALETQESDEGRYSDRYVDGFGSPNKETSPTEEAYHTINLGNQPNEPAPVVTPFKESFKETFKESFKESFREAKEDKNPFNERRPSIERKYLNVKQPSGKATVRKYEFDRFGKSNKEQANNLIEAQNSIRNILNKRSEPRK